MVIVSIHNPGEVTYWGEHAFCAAGSTVAEMPPDDILKLRIQLPGLIDYSNQHRRSSYNDDLVWSYEIEVGRRGHVLEVSRAKDRLQTLRALSLYDREAARILFGKTQYRLVQYVDGEPIINERREGLFGLLLPEFIQELCGSDGGRFPARALKEALANAVAHAAYFEADGDIILEIFHDRLVISNLCLRESAYFANRWFSRSHKTVNGLLMESLRVAGLVDELGRGKNLIFSESIKAGKRPPEVQIENAGKYQRWKLVIYGGNEDAHILRILTRCREVYDDERKALIALALVLWRDLPVSEIRNYVDGDFARQFAEVLASESGPIFYSKEEDRIVLRRWAEVLLGEGKDSKVLSHEEEERLLAVAYEHQRKSRGFITPANLRDLAAMGNTRSEQVLTSNLLAKWVSAGMVRRAGRGRYELVERRRPANLNSVFDDLVELFGAGDFQVEQRQARRTRSQG